MGRIGEDRNGTRFCDCLSFFAPIAHDVLFGLGESTSKMFRVGSGFGSEGKVSFVVGHVLPTSRFRIDSTTVDCWRIVTSVLGHSYSTAVGKGGLRLLIPRQGSHNLCMVSRKLQG